MGIEHVGLGAVFLDTVHDDSLSKTGMGLEGFTAPDAPALVAALRSRGYDGHRLDAILSTNWLRILRTALPA
jgi:microsomal dipeptidase-like Zn-dependent dipeptidase